MTDTPATRPDLADVRTRYQVATDQMIDYHPRLFGGVDIPFTDSARVTRTEGEMLDDLTFNRGLLGLKGFDDIRKQAFSEASSRYPDQTPPAGMGAADARTWQQNDGHRDAFRHTYWNALMAKEYGQDWATRFATAHEGGPDNPANREAMDLFNNEVGRRVAANNPNASASQLADQVQQAVARGETVVLDSPGGNLAWSDRVALGHHGQTPPEVIGPHLGTPTPGSLSQNGAALPGQPYAALASHVAAEDPMHAQIHAGVQVNLSLLDATSRDRATESLYATALEAKMRRVDQVVVSREGTRAGAGEYVSLVQGDPASTIYQRETVKIADVASATLEQSQARVQALESAQVRDATLNVPDPVRQQESPSLRV